MASTPPSPVTPHRRASRIVAIDLLRGFVMLVMLVDHVRETIYLHHQVGDPMDAQATEPALFFTRLAAHLCAPAFVFLTGLGAWLHANPVGEPPRSAAGFLLRRGLMLLALEVTLVSFAWTGQFPLQTVYLQVIWAIGLSMIALAAVAGLPLRWLAAAGLAIVFGHNLLTPIGFNPGEAGHALWTILHDRGWLITEGPVKVKVSYPLLPWIGVILLGHAAGPLYAATTPQRRRQALLATMGLGCLALLVLLRGFNLYGETLPWAPATDATHTLMAWVNFTKYPPSLDFLLLTLGLALLLLCAFEHLGGWPARILRDFGGAPMFFYLLHLYALLAIQKGAVLLAGANHGGRFGVDSVGWVWALAGLLAVVLYPPTAAFGRLKRRSGNALLRYF